MSDLLRDPIAGDVPLSGIIDPLIREGDLYEWLPGGTVHCFACGHNCKIKPGARGIASSYNEPLITSEWAMDIFKQANYLAPAGECPQCHTRIAGIWSGYAST